MTVRMEEGEGEKGAALYPMNKGYSFIETIRYLCFVP